MEGFIAPPQPLPLILLRATSGGGDGPPMVKVDVRCDIARLHFSLVNGVPQELLQLVVAGLRLDFCRDLASPLQPVIEASLSVQLIQAAMRPSPFCPSAPRPSPLALRADPRAAT